MAGKTLILIHGRNWKPPKARLKRVWLDALRGAIKRDQPDVLASFNKLKKEFIYYGDISNRFLSEHLGEPMEDDTESRREALAALLKWKKRQFAKATYNTLPGIESFKEGAVSVLGPVLSFFRLSESLISSVAPDMGEYWNESTRYGSLVRIPLIKPLMRAMKNDRSICVVAHSMGSMIAYDTFWKFSHKGEYYDYWQKKIDLFISLGSPLGDATVQRHLKGHRHGLEKRYPTNIVQWKNFYAEDDYISHDGKIADDYKEMKKLKLIRSIRDTRIYNLSVRDGKSNPHHISGYLVNPKVIQAIVTWIQS